MTESEFYHFQDKQCQNQSKQENSSGRWLFQENLLYAIFLQINKAIMASKKQRKNTRIFQQMSEFISTRNPLQCRSHHQKLLEKMGVTKVILSNFKKNVGNKYFKKQFANFLSKRELQMPQIPQNNEACFLQTPTHQPSQQASQIELKSEETNLYSSLFFYVPIYDWSTFIHNGSIVMPLNYNL